MDELSRGLVDEDEDAASTPTDLSLRSLGTFWVDLAVPDPASH